MESHATRRLTAEHVAARALMESPTFGDAAPKILQAICEALDWEYGALWRIDRELKAARKVGERAPGATCRSSFGEAAARQVRSRYLRASSAR